MSSVTSPRRKRKPTRPVRLIRWIGRPTIDGAGMIRIAAGREIAIYDYAEIECGIEGCRGFRLRKHSLAREEYHVLLSMSNPQDRQCECMGFLAHGHCKHVEGLVALLNSDDRPGPTGGAAALPFNQAA